MEGLRGPILKVVGAMEDPRKQLSGYPRNVNGSDPGLGWGWGCYTNQVEA